MAGQHTDAGLKLPIPKGIEHLTILSETLSRAREQADGELRSQARLLTGIGTALAGLYEVATCNRQCHGGAHILEALCGRAYNLGCSAFVLFDNGLYDEGLNLVRSLGEIANLIHLSIVDDAAIQKWIRADRKTRLKRFSPGAIRDRLKAAGHGDKMAANDDWYREFCERFTHPTPETVPNLHNKEGRGAIGGVFQKQGLRRGLAELSRVLSHICVIVTASTGMETEFLDELADHGLHSAVGD